MGAVPVAATLKVADCPAVIFALAGCEEIVGATAELPDVEPLPLRAIENVEPLDRVNCRVPEYGWAAVGLNVAEPLRLCPAFSVTGNVTPEKENCAAESATLSMVTLRRLSLVTVTLCVPLEPTATVPKLIDEGDTLTLKLVRPACAAAVQASNIAIATAVP